MTGVYIVGVGMTRFARQPEASVKQLTAHAVGAALADAGLAVGDIEAAFFANTVQGALEGQLMVRGQIALRPLGIEGIPIVNVENACASASTALQLAVNHIRAGAADVALAVGVDKMVVPDKQAMFGIFDGAWDVGDAAAGMARLTALGAGMAVPRDAGELCERSFFMDIYAAMARAHMAMYGTTREHIAAVSAKNHDHSVNNPLAQYRAPMTIEQVLGAVPVVWPFTVPMCAPVSDGGAAAILVSDRMLGRIGRARAVGVRASVLLTGITRDQTAFDQHLTAIGARRAYELAGVGPEDIDLAEVHDATAFAEIQQIENLQLVGFGDGGPATLRGETRLGGRVPVNPSGGLESKGHPIGATGLGQIFELVTQLRGEADARQVAGARLAIAENGGGFYGIEEATAALTILAAPDRSSARRAF
jgi:acetyl-CoA acetyltransferase